MKNSTKLNFIYNSLYQLLAIFLPLVTTPYLSRVLGAEKIGIYSYSYSIAYYFSMFIILGLNNYGNRTIAMVKDNKNDLSKSFFSIYYMQLTCAVVVIALYMLYAYFISNKVITWILLIYIMSSAIDISWFFFGLEQFKLTVIRNTVIKILSTIAIFLFVKKSTDIYIYAFILCVGYFLGPLMLWPFVKKNVYFCKVSKQDIISHFKPNLIMFLPVIAISLYKMMDKIMLGKMCNMSQVGYYENVEKVMQIPLALIGSLGTVMLPKMSNLIANDKGHEVDRIIEKSIIFVMVISSALSFGIMGVADSFVPWFYGEEFYPCVALFRILMPSCLFVAFANVIRTQFLIPNKKDSIYIFSVFLGAAVNLFINLILIPKYASNGAAIGTLCAEAAVCIYQIFKVRNQLSIKKYVFNIIPFIIIGLVMYGIIVNIPQLSNAYLVDILLKVLIGGLIYVSFSSIYLIRHSKKIERLS